MQSKRRPWKGILAAAVVLGAALVAPSAQAPPAEEEALVRIARSLEKIERHLTAQSENARLGVGVELAVLETRQIQRLETDLSEARRSLESAREEKAQMEREVERMRRMAQEDPELESRLENQQDWIRERRTETEHRLERLERKVLALEADYAAARIPFDELMDELRDAWEAAGR